MFTLESLHSLQADLGRDSLAFLPELILCGGIVLLLLLRLFRPLTRVHLGWVALALSAAALVAACFQWRGVFGLERPAHYGGSLSIFSGLLIYDNFTIFLRLFLIFFGCLMVWLTLLTGIPDREDSADFYCLLFGATLGMCVMASANHLLMVFIGVEMASLPSYALAGFLKGKRKSSEASLKYVVYGGGASGVMLYGISLLVGKFGTGSLPALAQAYIQAMHPGSAAGVDAVLVLGTLFLIIGLAFKLAAVPFHFWCPDVFEGASAEVAGFLSVASKGAALALFARVVFAFGGGVERAISSDAVVDFLVPTIAIFAAVTATFGNLAAYLQTNLKRLLAYSTIAHAGYMMMGLAPLTRDGASAVLFYLVAYLFMNLGAFAVVAILRNQLGSEELSDYRGLIRRAPVLTVTLAVFLLSLLGIPPLLGFFGKFQVFAALYHGGQIWSAHGQHAVAVWLYALLVIGGLNTVLSVMYYLKVMKVMILETTLDEVEGRPSPPLSAPESSVVFASLLAGVLLVVGILWGPLARMSDHGVRGFNEPPAKVVAQNATEVPQ